VFGFFSVKNLLYKFNQTAAL